MHLLIKIKPQQPREAQDLLQQYYQHYIPKFATDSGLDLVTPTQVVIPPHATVGIHLGICCAIDVGENAKPHGYYLYPRSSLSRTHLRMANSVGIIDFSYRGEIIAMVDNWGDCPETVTPGSKLFQICAPDLTPVSFRLVDQLDETERGSDGFGSTGGT